MRVAARARLVADRSGAPASSETCRRVRDAPTVEPAHLDACSTVTWRRARRPDPTRTGADTDELERPGGRTAARSAGPAADMALAEVARRGTRRSSPRWTSSRRGRRIATVAGAGAHSAARCSAPNDDPIGSHAGARGGGRARGPGGGGQVLVTGDVLVETGRRRLRSASRRGFAAPPSSTATLDARSTRVDADAERRRATRRPRRRARSTVVGRARRAGRRAKSTRRSSRRRSARRPRPRRPPAGASSMSIGGHAPVHVERARPQDREVPAMLGATFGELAGELVVGEHRVVRGDHQPARARALHRRDDAPRSPRSSSVVGSRAIGPERGDRGIGAVERGRDRARRAHPAASPAGARAPASSGASGRASARPRSRRGRARAPASRPARPVRSVAPNTTIPRATLTGHAARTLPPASLRDSQRHREHVARRPRRCGRSSARAPARARRPGRPRSASAGSTSVRPARWAASTFCFTPPIGSTRPCSVTSPVMPTIGAHRRVRSAATRAPSSS